MLIAPSLVATDAICLRLSGRLSSILVFLPRLLQAGGELAEHGRAASAELAASTFSRSVCARIAVCTEDRMARLSANRWLFHLGGAPFTVTSAERSDGGGLPQL